MTTKKNTPAKSPAKGTARKPATGSTRAVQGSGGTKTATGPKKPATGRPALPAVGELIASYGIATQKSEAHIASVIQAAAQHDLPLDTVWIDRYDVSVNLGTNAPPLLTTLNDLLDRGEQMFVEAIIAFAQTDVVRAREREWLAA